MNWNALRLKYLDRNVINLMALRKPTAVPIADDIQKPFFILGTGRNGSTLLSCILNNHSNIFIPGEAYILKRLFFYTHFLPLIGWNKFVQVNLNKLKSRSVNWKIDFEEAEKQLLQLPKAQQNVRNFWETMNRIYGRKYNNTNFIWGDKTPVNTDYAKLLIKHFPDARFIFLLRDPRAVINSYLKTNYNKFYPEIDFLLWKWNYRIEQYEWLAKQNKTILIVQFEKIVAAPTIEIKSILDFLKLPHQTNVLDDYHKNMPLLGIENQKIHENIRKGIDHKIATQWQKELDAEIVKRINSKLGTTMAKYNYS